MKLKVLLAALVATAVAAGIGASVRPAAAGNYACFSQTGAPVLFTNNNDPRVFPTWSTYATGWSTPYAESKFSTSTPMLQYYLTCSIPPGWTIVNYILAGGNPIATMVNYVINGQPIPGVYPVIAPPLAAAVGK